MYVNFHGGGFVVARPQQDDHICRYIAATADCVVINVDYAVSPQRRFPTAVTQAYDVTAWVAENGPANGWDGSRLAVGGHSAGASLTAAVAAPPATAALSRPGSRSSTPPRSTRSPTRPPSTPRSPSRC